MMEKTFCLSLGLIVILFPATPLLTGVTEDPTYSEVDGECVFL